MEEGLLSLKWNNHKSTFFHVLSILREKHTYTDVTLACDGRLYPVHKFILSTCSEYFSDIFKSNTGNNIVVVLKDVRKQDLEYLLDYMYLGQVDVAQSELSSLIKTAECLRIKGLAIPDDEPQVTSRRGLEERERDTSPPSKKKRLLVDENRPSGASSNNISSRIQPLLSIPPPSSLPPNTVQQQQALLHRLQVPISQQPQPPPTSHPVSKSLPLSHTPSSRTPQIGLPTSPVTNAPHPSHAPPLSSPTQPSVIPVIKQEVTDPLESDYEDTKPDVSENQHLEQDMAVAGPSGIQGSADNWDGESDLGSFGHGEAYSEGGMEEPGDSEAQGGRIRVKSRRELGLLSVASSIPSVSSSSTVSSSSPSVIGPNSCGGSSSLLTPSPTHAYTPVMSPLPTSPIPPGSPGMTSPSTSPMTTPLNLSYPLKCHHCNYIGTCESVFLRHLRTHGGGVTGVRLYNCNSCPYSATQWESVRRHAWRQHRQEVDSEKEAST